MSAIRLARGYTGRQKIIKFDGCYHGHVDSLLVKAGSGLATFGVSSSAGVPEPLAQETIVLDLNDLNTFENLLEEHGSDIAAVIIEPVPANNGLLLQETSFLAWLRKLCDDHEILLIFDEVISGFRIGFEGAAGYYSIEPDLLTFGKIIGGGLPVGAFGGRKEIMDYISPVGPVYQAGTLSANPIALSAGTACIEELLTEGFYDELNEKTKIFAERINAHAIKRNYPLQVQQIASIFWISFSKVLPIKASDINPESMNLFKELHKELLDQGVYLGPSGYEVGFVSQAHRPDDLMKASDIICSSLDSIFTSP
jgi:glutamate-1-semialdehyde 2,1-aminomutase